MASFYFFVFGLLLCWLVTHEVSGAVSQLSTVCTREELIQLNSSDGGTDLTPRLPDFVLWDFKRMRDEEVKKRETRRSQTTPEEIAAQLDSSALFHPGKRLVPDEQDAWTPGEHQVPEGLQGVLCNGLHWDVADGAGPGHRPISQRIWSSISFGSGLRENAGRWSVFVCEQPLLWHCDCQGAYLQTRRGTSILVTAPVLPPPWVSPTFYHYSLHSFKGSPPSVCSTIAEAVQRLQSLSTDAPKFITGDFNHVCLKTAVKNFYQ